MTQYIPVICFAAGLLAGFFITYAGFKLGFRASVEIRNIVDPEAVLDGDQEKGLLGRRKKEPAEFDLLDEQERTKKE